MFWVVHSHFFPLTAMGKSTMPTHLIKNRLSWEWKYPHSQHYRSWRVAEIKDSVSYRVSHGG